MVSRGMHDDGFEYHRQALLHYKRTLGNRHHRTADVFVKLAEHAIRLGHYENALAFLDHAHEAYSDSAYYLPEKVRISFKRSLALRRLRRVAEADSELSKCFKQYNMLFNNLVRSQRAKEGDRKKERDLCDADFDNLIAFWSM
jgi:tetratricopeptide (TPR) repeat protein